MNLVPTGVRGRFTLAFVLALLVAVLLGVAGFGGYDMLRKQQAQDDRDAAAQAARQMAVNMVSVDYQQAQQGFDRVLASLTGEARDTFATQSKVWIDQVTKAKARSVVDKIYAGVVNGDGDSAEVIVSVSSVVTGPQMPNGVVRSYRYSLDLTKTNGRWLVSKIGLVP